MAHLSKIRQRIRDARVMDENDCLDHLIRAADISEAVRRSAADTAAALVTTIRTSSDPGLMEVFLAEYGLSTDEGVALMCLAEALLRVPDTDTIDALIEDKIAPSAWGEHLGKSSSPLVNASTWALLLTGKVLGEGKGMASVLHGAVKRLGEPVIRTAVGRAMKELGAQFVLGETIAAAIQRSKPAQSRGYTFSYDMLGEAALTAKDAKDFFNAYAGAITTLAPECRSDDIRDNPGISIKLSALHPRYEEAQRDRVLSELTERALLLAKLAREAGMGFNIDAEEADRLDLSLDVIERVLRDPGLSGWDGFGVVVQAYGKRAGPVLDWLYALAETSDRKIMVRLVKGAYWDSEIKHAQVEGLAAFPVFTRKAATDVSYICCAQKLLGMTDRVYPQFATHNAHSVAAILEMASDRRGFEFQRLHGMGEALHDHLVAEAGVRSRIYAPVGAHEDLLAYLVRRLLENGANSSFVNQVVDEDVSPEEIGADPFEALLDAPVRIKAPNDLFAPERANSTGFDLSDGETLARIDAARAPFKSHQWQAEPILAVQHAARDWVEVTDPAAPYSKVGQVQYASREDVDTALGEAVCWDAPSRDRADILARAADLYEARFGEIFALLAREAGKALPDAVGELREAVDFLRYYGAQATAVTGAARGTFVCISPWNFPLAIFTGQIAAALAAGNAVLAKPAEATSLIAHLAVRLLHEAGVPRTALQLLPGTGAEVGAKLTQLPDVAGVCFTGSTATALSINRAMAAHMAPDAPLIAETGGLNAMIVDSTALPQQAVGDVLASAFQSAGQRCSALRVLYVQKDVAEPFLDMLFGAMDELCLGAPWHLSSDVGPAIDGSAADGILAHIAKAEAEGRVLKSLVPPEVGHFVPPTVIQVNGIGDLDREIFGPVLHVATFEADALDAVIRDINETGYGLTFGMHSRIDDRVETVTERIKAGNIYVNRNQIGAVVGSQPFGGEGLSGTGPKAGGPSYVARFSCDRSPARGAVHGVPTLGRADVQDDLLDLSHVQKTLTSVMLPGPTGESNQLLECGRGVVLCLGPTSEDLAAQIDMAKVNGATPFGIASGVEAGNGLAGVLDPLALETLQGFDLVVSFSIENDLRLIRKALAARDGKIIPLLTHPGDAGLLRLERHICIDTTAAGGNATLLAEMS